MFKLTQHASVALLGVCCLLPCLQSQVVPQFEDGERVCFIGDSITHGGSYHNYVYLFYLTRYPGREISFWNRGVSGDSAYNVLKRFETDIEPVKPSVSTLMLGMNDVGRWLYGSGKKDSAAKSEQEKMLNYYYENINKLVSKIDATGSDLILMTPSIYDQTADIERANDFGVNDALGTCSDYIKRYAQEHGHEVIDLHEPMLRLNTQKQRQDPTFSIVGPDRVHPSADPGHFFMAYQFLKAQGVSKYVSKVHLDGKRGKVLSIENAAVSELEIGNAFIDFTLLEGSLPFPQTQGIARGLKLVPFEKEMNQQVLSIQGLDAGLYSLDIDGIKVGTWTASEFVEGISLATIETTPQHKQALRVHALNQERNAKQSQLRDLAFVYYGSGLSEAALDQSDTEAVKGFLGNKLEKQKGQPWYAYLKQQYDSYLSKKDVAAGIESKFIELHHKLYSLNTPIPHRYRIKKVDSKDEERMPLYGHKDLPKVLLIGDSISMGYTNLVRQGLKGIASVERPNGNCGDTRNGLRMLDQWLGDAEWDVIHFNWGLHDLCYRNYNLASADKRDKTHGVLSVPLKTYSENLEALVLKLKATGAKLIWASTTVVPEGEPGRIAGDAVNYNKIARTIMERHGVVVNDLHRLSSQFSETWFSGPGNVHFKGKGTQELAQQVINVISDALEKEGL